MPLSGNSNDGQTHGSPAFVDREQGKALEFDGIDDWAELTDFEVPESFSVSAWVNPYTINDGQNFIGKHTASGGNIFLFGYWENGKHVRIRNATNTGGVKETGYHHLTVTVNKVGVTQSEVKMYRNGILLWESTLDDVMGNTQGKPWVLGQEWDGGSVSDLFQGALDEVAFYNHTLTEEEVSSIYTDGVKVTPRTVKSYSYDAGGNILKKEEYDYNDAGLTLTNSIDYRYADTNWKDKLTSYNGKSISYDKIGNPLSYDGWNFTWEAGRQLATMSNGTTNLEFKYNDAGIRTEKTVNSVTTKYTLNGNNVIFEDNGTDQIHYTYGANGQLLSMNLTTTATPSINGEYYYIHNAQGNVIGLYDSNGTKVVSYSYDAWGKITSTTGSLASTIGEKNPYLYRGYRYDSETGLYYLQSRYYNAEWGRFVNADGITGIHGMLQSHNMFAYGLNNPVNMVDPEGNWAWLLIPVAVYLGQTALETAPDVALDAALDGEDFNLKRSIGINYGTNLIPIGGELYTAGKVIRKGDNLVKGAGKLKSKF